MEVLAKDAIDSMREAVKTAGQVLQDLENLGEDFINSKAGFKTKLFILAAVEEISKVA